MTTPAARHEGGEHDGRLWKWYAATHVSVAQPDGTRLTLRPEPEGQSGEWPWGRFEEAWILTACNPRSVPLSESDNLARHRLLGRLVGLAGSTMSAAQFLVLGAKARALWQGRAHVTGDDIRALVTGRAGHIDSLPRCIWRQHGLERP